MKLAYCALIPLAIVFLPSIILNFLIGKPSFNWEACWKLDNSLCKSEIEIKSSPINVEQSVLDDLKERLKNRRRHNFVFDSGVNTSKKVDPEYGLKPEYLESILSYWEKEYDWREFETKMNSWNPKKATIDGLGVHFFHVKPQSKPKVTKGDSLPVLFVHGWPGSVWEFNKVINYVQNPATRDYTFEAVIPSLPGYGFSEAAEKPGLETCQMGIMFVKLMKSLGYNKFICQGGDWGSLVCQCAAAAAPENVAAMHLNFFPFMPPLWSQFALPHLQQDLKKTLFNVPYLLQQMSAPNTIGLALSDSPAAVGAWILEKMVIWADPGSKVLPEDYVTNIMCYWVTDSIFTSVRLYKESLAGVNSNMVRFTLGSQTSVKTGLLATPMEISHPPLNKYVLRSRYSNIVQFTKASYGGHYAALEVPRVLFQDFQEFLAKLNQ